MKDNAIFQVTKGMVDNTRKKDAQGVLKEQYITIGFKQEGGGENRLKLKRITNKTEDGRVHVFITNDFRLPAEEIAIIDKNRWMIELLFKQIKQNFPLRYFWGESPNAIKMQIYCVLMAKLLTVVIRKKLETRKSFANMITMIRLHLMSYVSLWSSSRTSSKSGERRTMCKCLFLPNFERGIYSLFSSGIFFA
jgi:hypothetical protein